MRFLFELLRNAGSAESKLRCLEIRSFVPVLYGIHSTSISITMLLKFLKSVQLSTPLDKLIIHATVSSAYLRFFMKEFTEAGFCSSVSHEVEIAIKNKHGAMSIFRHQK